MTLQHRHFFPGYEGPKSLNDGWWHDANMKHIKYPTAHDGEILETREHVVVARGPNKAKVPMVWDEYLLKMVPFVDPAKALYQSPPEYATPIAAAAVVKEAEEVLMDAAEAKASKNLPRHLKV